MYIDLNVMLFLHRNLSIVVHDADSRKSDVRVRSHPVNAKAKVTQSGVGFGWDSGVSAILGLMQN